MLNLLILLIIALVIAAVLFFTIHRRQAKLPPVLAQLKDITDPAGHYALGVVGDYVPPQTEAATQPPIRLAMLALRPIPTPFDPQAVRVFFGPDEVGQLSRDDAHAYHHHYGTQPTRCRGLIADGGASSRGVWLSARLGSGLSAVSAALYLPDLYEMFPLEVEADSHDLEQRAAFMAGQAACLVDVSLAMAGDLTQVRAKAFGLGVLPADLSRVFAQVHGLTTVSTVALIQNTVDGYTVNLLVNRALEDVVA
jgi:hypothetical protein